MTRPAPIVALVTVTVGLALAGCSSAHSKSAPTSTSKPVPSTSATAIPTPSTSSSPPVSSAGSASSTTPESRRPGPPCGFLARSATNYDHVIWIFMENHSSASIIGSTQAPYLNDLASGCGLAANYHNVTHPSLPNYVAATSGLALPSLSAFSSDCEPSASCSTPAPSIFSEGESWAAYEDSMPSDCYPSNTGEYAARHNPALYYSALSGCSSHDVPFANMMTAVADSSLPAFSFVTPDLLHDMHDGTVSEGDSWLSENLPSILNSGLYRSGRVVVMITWDEGEGGSSDNCATNTVDVGCHVPAIVVSPSTTPGTVSSVLFSHYSLLRTTEELLHLPLLGQAQDSASMRGPFDL